MGVPLWDRLRLLFKRSNLYQQERILQNQTDLSRIITNNEFINYSKQGSLLQQTNLQINRLERYKDFDQMDEVGEITLAMDMYADEASLISPESKHVVQVQAKSKRVKEELEDLFFNTLMIDRDARPITRYLAKYGDAPFEITLTSNRDGVQALRFMNVYYFTRIETKFGDLVGFFFQDPLTPTPVFLHPCQCMHLRLTSYENIYHPYGRSLLDGARKDFKRLRLMEDAALVYRITRAPEKRIFSIPVGNIPPREVPQYIELIARTFKKRKFVDPATGSVNERYSPLIQEDDFFLPKRPDGSGPTIDTLPGAENLDAIADIEYFKKKMISALKIPFSRVGIGDQSEPDGKSLSSVSPEFAKAIQWIQREIASGLKKVAIIHLALRGYSVDDMKNFDISMTAASAIDELYRIEAWNSRAEIIDRLMGIGTFTPKWVMTTFTDLSEDEVQEMQQELSGQAGEELGGAGGLEGLGGAPDLGGLALEHQVRDIDLDFGDDDDDDGLIQEYKNMENRIAETNELFEEVDTIVNEEKIYNGFAKILNDKELDGLEGPAVNEGKGEILMETTIDEDEWEESKEETKRMISEYQDLEPSDDYDKMIMEDVDGYSERLADEIDDL
jgi:hypothetical protein